MAWLDLTRPVRAGMDVFTEDGYSDVRVGITGWSTVAGQGFATQRLVLGTQTGTHIDAPAHFVDGAATLDVLPAAAGMGRFRLLAVDDLPGARLEPGLIPLLDARGHAPVPLEVVASVSRLDPRITPLVALLGAPACAGPDPYALNRAFAAHGIFLVEDLDDGPLPAAAHTGRVVIAWPRLVGTSGAPCRVLLQMERG